MIEILRNKNQTTRFQILVEIANSGTIPQKDIAEKLDITPQAVSDYVSQLINEGLLASKGRFSYQVTNEGVNWIIKMLRDLSQYTAYVRTAITNISVCAAIAESNLERNQKVGLVMKNGVLMATANGSHEATGISISGAKAGEDIGISNIEGIVPLKIGKVTILKIPGVQKGGSKKVNYAGLKKHLYKSPFTLAIGLESFAALQESGAEFCRFGAAEAAIEAAQSGLSPVVVCVDDLISTLLARLQEQNMSYDIIDLTKSGKTDNP